MTLAHDLTAAPPAPIGPAKFPDAWREELAGGDAAHLKDLQRFASPGDLAKAWRELRTERDSGKVKPVVAPPAANATDEAKAEWRKAQGLPDKPETYVEKLALPDGVTIGEQDKPLVAEFAKMVFDRGGTQDEMNRAVSWFYTMQDRMEAQRAMADGGHKDGAMAALMQEWGPGDYKANMAAVGTLQAAMPDNLRAMLLGARTEDGRLVGNTAEYHRWAAATARDFYPAATLVSPGDANAGKTIADEIEHISGVYRKAVTGDRDAHRQYYGYDGKPGLDARQRELIDAQQRMKERGRAA